MAKDKRNKAWLAAPTGGDFAALSRKYCPFLLQCVNDNRGQAALL
jgi:hypothetical protein